jgi:hypothetical protein
MLLVVVLELDGLVVVVVVVDVVVVVVGGGPLDTVMSTELPGLTETPAEGFDAMTTPAPYWLE